MTIDARRQQVLYHYGWIDGQTVPVRTLDVPLSSPTSQYAIALFEGVIGYPIRDERLIGLVALREHFDRLLAAALGSDLGFNRDPEALSRLIHRGMDEIHRLLYVNSVSGTIYIRPTLFHRGTGNVCLGPALDGAIHLGIYVQRWDGYMAMKPEGQRCLISPYLKAASPVAHLKCSANYGLAIPAKIEAKRAGYDEILLRDARGFIAEGSSQNLIVDMGDRLVTPRLVGHDGRPSPILPGITLRILRDTIAPSLGLEIEEDFVLPDDLFDPKCKGLALCGTATEVRHIGRLDWPDGLASIEFPAPSHALRMLMDAYGCLTRGKAYPELLTIMSL